MRWVYHSPDAAMHNSLSEEGKQLGSPVSPGSPWGPHGLAWFGMWALRSPAQGSTLLPLKRKP